MSIKAKFRHSEKSGNKSSSFSNMKTVQRQGELKFLQSCFIGLLSEWFDLVITIE